MKEYPLRKPHASLDVPHRLQKGRKIERLLAFGADRKQYRLLEIGCGSGGISHYFAMHADRQFDVDSVDVRDGRLIDDGYRFQLVDGVNLPFEDNTFDVVISNHVIEHVGDAGEQKGHLMEIRRVLKDEGIGYVAVPSRWMLVEPHFKLAFLSWWPEAWRTGWLRFWGKGEFYDCRPFRPFEIELLLEEVGFRFQQVHLDALRATFEIERPHALVWTHLLRRIPKWVFHLVRRAFPTLIYILRKK